MQFFLYQWDIEWNIHLVSKIKVSFLVSLALPLTNILCTSLHNTIQYIA